MNWPVSLPREIVLRSASVIWRLLSSSSPSRRSSPGWQDFWGLTWLHGWLSSWKVDDDDTFVGKHKTLAYKLVILIVKRAENDLGVAWPTVTLTVDDVAFVQKHRIVLLERSWKVTHDLYVPFWTRSAEQDDHDDQGIWSGWVKEVYSRSSFHLISQIFIFAKVYTIRYTHLL